MSQMASRCPCRQIEMKMPVTANKANIFFRASGPAFFHLFTEEKQRLAAHALASLLAPTPGSMIFGSHMGTHEPEGCTRPSELMGEIFAHSPESWTKLWDGGVFKKGTVKVEAGLVEIERKDLTHISEETKFYLLWWSVTRL